MMSSCDECSALSEFSDFLKSKLEGVSYISNGISRQTWGVYHERFGFSIVASDSFKISKLYYVVGDKYFLHDIANVFVEFNGDVPNISTTRLSFVFYKFIDHEKFTFRDIYEFSKSVTNISDNVGYRYRDTICELLLKSFATFARDFFNDYGLENISGFALKQYTHQTIYSVSFTDLVISPELVEMLKASKSRPYVFVRGEHINITGFPGVCKLPSCHLTRIQICFSVSSSLSRDILRFDKNIDRFVACTPLILKDSTDTDNFPRFFTSNDLEHVSFNPIELYNLTQRRLRPNTEQ